MTEPTGHTIVFCDHGYADRRNCAQCQARRADALARQLRNFLSARRYDRDTFADDTDFTDWVLSRTRHVLEQTEDLP